MENKIIIFKENLPILTIKPDFNVKYQSPTPKKEIPKSKTH